MKREGKILPARNAASRYIFIPAMIATEPDFPFEDGEDVELVIRKGELSVRKKKK